MADTAAEYARLSTCALLIGGTRSPAYLQTALHELGAVLPEVRRVTFPDVRHEGPENDGGPDQVAQILRDFSPAA